MPISKPVQEAFDAAQLAIDRIKDDHRPTAVWAALTAILHITHVLEAEIAEKKKAEETPHAD